MIDEFLYPALFFGSTALPVVVIMGVVAFLWWLGSYSQHVKERQITENSLFQYKLSTAQSFIAIILMLALLALSERFLYDLTRYVVTPSVTAYFSAYFDNLQVITTHSIVIVLFLIVSIVVNVLVAEKRQRYAVVLIPYFATAIALSIQLALQIVVYFYNHHTRIQLYIVLALLIVISSIAIYLIQDRFTKHLKDA